MKTKPKRVYKGWAVGFGRINARIFTPAEYHEVFSIFETEGKAKNWAEFSVHPSNKPRVFPVLITLLSPKKKPKRSKIK